MGNSGTDGKANPGAAAASGIKVSVGIGSSSNQSNSSSVMNTAAGSTVKAAGDIVIRATQGDATLQGAAIEAGQNIELSAARDVKIVASTDTQSQRSSNKSSSNSMGVSVGVGTGSSGLSLDMSASRGKGQANSDSTYYNNSELRAGKQVSISSGADTHIAGGKVVGQQVTASVGGNLNIESLQDTATSNAKQNTTGISVSIPVVGTGGSASLSVAQQNSNSNYQSVGEQSGIEAGAEGFQLHVKGATDLKGARITSNADASKNTLSTSTLNTSEIANRMSASASSSGVSVGTNMMQGKYEMGKALVGNTANKGSANQSDASTTTTAISAAQVTVGNTTTDTSQQTLIDSNGKAINTDTSATHRTLAKANVSAMQQQAQQQQADNMLAFKAAVALADPAFKAMFLTEAKIYTNVKDKDGNIVPDKNGNPKFRELSLEEKSNLKAGPDGKVHIANNGIFNGTELDPSAAAKYAQQNNGANYFIHFPEANNSVSELLIAAYQKHLEGNVLGLTNATQEVKNLMQQHGQSGLQLDGHSRGSMTVGNALESLANDSNTKGALSNTSVNFYGPAYSVKKADDLMSWLQNRSSMPSEDKNKAMLLFQNHNADPVGGWSVIGSNPGTAGTIPPGSSTFVEQIRAVTGQKTTVHNCYGSGGKACEQFWNDSPNNKPISLPALPENLAPRVKP